MFPVYGGKCLLRKAVHDWVRWRSSLKDVRKTQMLKRSYRSGWDNSEDVCAAGFDGRVYQFWWRICREIIVFFFSGSTLTCFTFYINLWSIYWLSLVVFLIAVDSDWRKIESTHPNYH
jgi:hypothetical protein